MSHQRISRRTILKGLGTAMALPVLEAMWPTRLVATAAAPAFPKRLAFLYVPNGIHMPDWIPSSAGANFALPPTLAPLESVRDNLTVLSGLAQQKAFPNGDGPGDHARSASTFLTGVQVRKTHGADIQAGTSADQIVAQTIGHRTRFPSLELGCEDGRQSGECDSGYSCAYSNNISWKSPTLPLAKDVNPRTVFERLFGNDSRGETAANRELREQYRKSVLDFVSDDAQRLRTRLGRTDQRKLDEYLTSVRELEQRIEFSESEKEGAAELPKMVKPKGIPKAYADHLRLMADLLVLAFQTDQTRVATFMFANEGSNKSYKFIDVPEGHHDLSHHGGNAEKQAKIAQINKFHVTQLAYFAERLAAIREGDGTLLDNSMIVYGSGIGDGNSHNHNKLPVLMLGKGGDTIRPGRHLNFGDDTPLNNLFLSLLDRMDSPIDELGDSTGLLLGLEG